MNGDEMFQVPPVLATGATDPLTAWMQESPEGTSTPIAFVDPVDAESTLVPEGLLTSTSTIEVEVRPGPALSLAELRQRYSGELDWIIVGVAARGELGFIAGAGESLKSWVMAHLAAAIDGRFPWLGAFPVLAERVLYVEQERGGNLVYQLDRIEKAEGVILGSDRLRIIDPFTPLPLSEKPAQDLLEGEIADFRPDVVIINALRDVLGRANENSPTDLAALLRPLGHLAERYRCSVMVIDHFNKAGVNGAVRGNAAHGGTAQKHNEADFVLVAERPRDELGKAYGATTVSVTKRRAGEPVPAFSASVVDTADGGVLVRAEMGVVALSSRARRVYEMLAKEGPATVETLTAVGMSKENIANAISELRKAELVLGQGEKGRAHIYTAITMQLNYFDVQDGVWELRFSKVSV